jgi:hypothetical protein
MGALAVPWLTSPYHLSRYSRNFQGVGVSIQGDQWDDGSAERLRERYLLQLKPKEEAVSETTHHQVLYLKEQKPLNLTSKVGASTVSNIVHLAYVSRMATICNLVIRSRLPLKSCISPHIILVMPQQRAMSSNKRKAPSGSDGEKPVGSKQTKKTKVAAPASDSAVEQNGLAPNGQPTNKVLPVNISFSPRVENATRIASWNICGLASSQKKVRCRRRVLQRLTP